MKILIEFYDSENIENVISLDIENFDKVYFLDLRDEDNSRGVAKAHLTEFIRTRYNTPTHFISISDTSLPAIAAVLKSIVKDDGEYVIDITGGSENIIAAMGFFAATMSKSNVRIHKFDIKSSTRICYFPTAKEEKVKPTFTVPDIIAMNGGKILGDEGSYRYNLLDGKLENETLRLWNCVKGIARDWNKFCGIPTITQNGRTAKLIEQKTESACRNVIRHLQRHGIISDPKMLTIGNKRYYTYKANIPEYAEFLYEKAGNLLEIYSYIAAVHTGVFDDCCVSVPLDWDGRPDGTTNEIDLILTRDAVPIFVSCKNTEIENEYLYEISTLTRHFGGEYAKTMIISNYSNQYKLRERAKEMDIILIDNINGISVEAFKEKLKKRT